MWRTLILMIGFAPWVYANFPLTFAVMYIQPVIIPMLIVSIWIMAYGVIAALWLAGKTRLYWLQALLVPVPVSLLIFWSDLHDTGMVERSVAWLYDIPTHAVGVGIGVLILHRRRRLKVLREAALKDQAPNRQPN